MEQKRARIGASRITMIAVVVIVVILAGIGIYYYAVGTFKASGTTSSSLPLILYSADAYVSESATLENSFTSSSGISMVAPKSGGSTSLGEQIALGIPVSAFISVAKSAVSQSILGSEFSGWAIAFESDQMALTYSNATIQNGAGASVIAAFQKALSVNTTIAWFDFFSNVTSGSVKVGISNPNSDPAGFRAWLVLQAAGYLYDNNDTNYFVNKMIQNKANITGASAEDLVSPLEEGNIQFLFIYKSAGLAQKLHLMHLPDQINLGESSYSSFYSKFSYTTTTGIQTGGVIALFITVPKDSTDATDSLSFVAYVVKNSGPLLDQFGLSKLSPAHLYNDSAVPQQIDQLILQGYLQESGSL